MPHFQQVMPRVTVADLGRTVAFYTGTLGFRVDVLWPDDRPTFAVLEREGVRLGFHEFAVKPAEPPRTELAFDVTGVAEFHAALASAVRVEWGPEVYSYGRREFAVRDPDGYLLIFGEPTDDPPTCDVE